MKVQIENYRGWNIEFDTEKESFYCHSEQHDKDENKKSFTSTKKWIDDFIKENEIFQPIWIEAKPKAYKKNKIKLIGIRKDGRFIYEDAEGEKKQLLDCDEKHYILYDESNEQYKEEAEILYNEMEALRFKINLVLDKITGIELIEYKKQLLGN